MIEIDTSKVYNGTRAGAIAHGALLYATDNPCKNGHNTARYTKTGACVECQNDATRTWRKRASALKGETGIKRTDWHMEAARWRMVAEQANTDRSRIQREVDSLQRQLERARKRIDELESELAFAPSRRNDDL